MPHVKDGLLFYNKHSHYQAGNTPLALVWKDENCGQYVIDTDSKGQGPNQQQVVFELLDDGRLATSDDPSIIFGCLNDDFIQKAGLDTGNLLRVAVNDGGLSFIEGRLEKADLQYLGQPNRAHTFADSYSKFGDGFACLCSQKVQNLPVFSDTIACLSVKPVFHCILFIVHEKERQISPRWRKTFAR